MADPTPRKNPGEEANEEKDESRRHQNSSVPVIQVEEVWQRGSTAFDGATGQQDLRVYPPPDSMIPTRAQFETVYNERRDEIYRYLLRLRVPAAEAQELTQEAFLRLFQASESGTSIDNARAWLFRVAHNLAIDERRRQAHETEQAEVLRLLATAVETPELIAGGKERARQLLQAMADLSKQQRACLHLRAEGLRYREIAVVLEISTPTVGEFLHRAMGRLRKAIYEP